MLSIYYKLEKFYYYPAASIFKPMIRILSLMKVQVQFFDVRNIVPVLFSRSSIINRQSLHFNMFFFWPLGITKVSFIVYFILFLSTCYFLLILFGESERYVGKGYDQFPTFRKYARKSLEVFVIGSVYYVFFFCIDFV
jgi:hypothetical protein